MREASGMGSHISTGDASQRRWRTVVAFVIRSPSAMSEESLLRVSQQVLMKHKVTELESSGMFHVREEHLNQDSCLYFLHGFVPAVISWSFLFTILKRNWI